MIRVTEAELPAVAAFLRQRPDRAMFPLSNLASYGLEGAADRAPSMWAACAGDRVTDVLTVTRGGAVFPVLPSSTWDAAAEILHGRDVINMIGPAEEVRPLLSAAGLATAPMTLDADEPQFLLDLAGLSVPAGPGRIVPLADIPREIALDWRAAYVAEAIGIPAERARETAEAELEEHLAAGSHAMLVEDDIPLAMTGFNATLPEIVQVGGVYTPPAARGRGLARRAVALHLAAARERGVRQATLFASGAAAIRAYRAIGFEQTGRFALCFFDGTQVAR